MKESWGTPIVFKHSLDKNVLALHFGSNPLSNSYILKEAELKKKKKKSINHRDILITF